MRDIYEVLYYKEMELRRIRKEIEVLHTVAPLLQDANEDGGDALRFEKLIAPGRNAGD